MHLTRTILGVIFRIAFNLGAMYHPWAKLEFVIRFSVYDPCLFILVPIIVNWSQQLCHVSDLLNLRSNLNTEQFAESTQPKHSQKQQTQTTAEKLQTET